MPDAQAAPAPLTERVFALPDEHAAETFGARLAAAITALQGGAAGGSAHERGRTAAPPFGGLQVHLLGDLGAGKTTLVRETLRALGHAGRVRSPTYTLVEPYTLENVGGAPLSIYHFDLYRFADPAEWEEAGFREYFDAGAICLIEWPQQAGGLLGTPDLELRLDVEGEGRRLTARAFSETGKECLARC
jgi:tRNA threonylcarbamoyladenosine biosynthesis protein TsaE